MLDALSLYRVCVPLLLMRFEQQELARVSPNRSFVRCLAGLAHHRTQHADGPRHHRNLHGRTPQDFTVAMEKTGSVRFDANLLYRESMNTSSPQPPARGQRRQQGKYFKQGQTFEDHEIQVPIICLSGWWEAASGAITGGIQVRPQKGDSFP